MHARAHIHTELSTVSVHACVFKEARPARRLEHATPTQAQASTQLARAHLRILFLLRVIRSRCLPCAMTLLCFVVGVSLFQLLAQT